MDKINEQVLQETHSPIVDPELALIEKEYQDGIRAIIASERGKAYVLGTIGVALFVMVTVGAVTGGLSWLSKKSIGVGKGASQVLSDGVTEFEIKQAKEMVETAPLSWNRAAALGRVDNKLKSTKSPQIARFTPKEYLTMLQTSANRLDSMFLNLCRQSVNPVIIDPAAINEVNRVLAGLEMVEANSKSGKDIEGPWRKLAAFCDIISRYGERMTWQRLVEKDIEEVKSRWGATGDAKTDFAPPVNIPSDKELGL